MLVEGERRITETWFAEVEARLFLNPSENSAAFENDSHLIARVSRYF